MTLRSCLLAAALAAMLGSSALAQSQPPAAEPQGPLGLPRNPLVEDMLRQPQEILRPPADIGTTQPAAPATAPQPSIDVASLPPEDQPENTPTELAPQFKRQLVD